MLKAKAKNIPFGIMTYWKQCADAFQYEVELSYKEENNSKNDYQKLTTVVNDSNTFYHTFSGLATGSYEIKIYAKSRSGEEIASDTVYSDVKYLYEYVECPDLNKGFW